MTEAGAETAGEPDADWGFNQKSGVSKETKIGLALIVVLVCAFGFVLYRKMHKQPDLLANIKDPSQAAAAENPEAASDEPPVEDGDESGFTAGARPLPPQADPQIEPAADDDFAFAQQEPPVQQEPQDAFFEQPAPLPPKQHPLKQTGQQSVSADEDEFHPFANASAQTEPPQTADEGFVMQQAAAQPAKKAAAQPLPAEDFGDPFGAAPVPKSQAQSQSPAQAPAGQSPLTDPFGNPVGAAAPAARPAAQPAASAVEPPQQFPADDFGDFEEFAPAAAAGAAAVARPQPATSALREAAKPAPVAEFDFEPFPTDEQAAQTEPEPFDANPAPFNQPKAAGTFAESPSPKVAAAPAQSEAADQPAAPDPFADSTPFGAGATPFPAATPNDSLGAHIVKSGENYWTISRKQYGAGRYYMALAEYNRQRIPDPKKLQPGMKVLVPTVEILAARYGNLIPGGAASAGEAGETTEEAGFFRDDNGRPAYRVGSRDTLTDIAQDHLGRAARWIQIYEMNRDKLKSPNDLKIGTVLRLPGDASRVEVLQQSARNR